MNLQVDQPPWSRKEMAVPTFKAKDWNVCGRLGVEGTHMGRISPKGLGI